MTVGFHRVFPFVRTVAGIVLGALLCVPGPLAAAEKFVPVTHAMVFSIVRASNPICEPICPEWIAADGEITLRTAAAFRAVLKKAGNRNLPLLVNSLGGDVDTAIEIGRMVRKRQMIVEVARTDYLRCGPREKKCKPELQAGVYYGYANTVQAICHSACTFVLAGGVRRIAGPLSFVGIHKSASYYEKYENIYKYYKSKGKDGKTRKKKKVVGKKLVGYNVSTKVSKGVKRQMEMYFKEMGVASVLVDLAFATPHEDIYFMTMSDLVAFKLATEIKELEVLVQYRICEGRNPPEYCMERK